MQSKILVVEDDDSIRLLLIETLQEHAAGVAVDAARDGVDALHHVSMQNYDVVILDVMMPYMTGIDFLDSLEAMISDPSVKQVDGLPSVIVITGASPEQIPNSAIQDRFPNLVRCVLRKPLDIQVLTDCVREYLA
jgi:CheY-like chemotaxis protein